MILKTHPDSAVCMMESLSVSLENFRNHTYRPGQVECRVWGAIFIFHARVLLKLASHSFFLFLFPFRHASPLLSFNNDSFQGDPARI